MRIYTYYIYITLLRWKRKNPLRTDIFNEQWSKPPHSTHNTVHSLYYCISVVYFYTFPLYLIWKRWHFSWKEDYVELVYAHLQMANVENWLFLHVTLWHFEWTVSILITTCTKRNKNIGKSTSLPFPRSEILCSMTRTSP